MVLYVYSNLLRLIRDGGKCGGGDGCLCPINHTARHDDQNDGTSNIEMANREVSLNVSTAVGNKVTKTVSEHTTVENNSSNENSPSPSWTHSPVSSL